jgi:alkylated DNA repair protein (DNA oxidative demethylase)
VSEPEAPAGLVYRPGFLTAEEEADLIRLFDGMEFEEVRMRGQTARRTVRHFGLDYDYEHWTVTPGEPLPHAMDWLRVRAAALAEVDGELAQTLVSRYPAGAGIGWHRDAPMFGAVVGVSLGSPSRMRFQRGRGKARETAAVELAPSSAYVIAGPARWQWQHSIPPTKRLRYSVTFRTLN